MGSKSKINQVSVPIFHKLVVIAFMTAVPKVFFAGCAFRENILKQFFITADDSKDNIENLGRIERETDENSSVEIPSNRSLWTESDAFKYSHPKHFSPERRAYLAAVQQSSTKDENIYHEALVHPGMFAHNNPSQIAIIGGSRGATLREILKHDTVEKVKMIEINEIMVETSKKHLSALSHCSDIMGSAASCFDDERVEILYEDPLACFVSNGKLLRSDESSSNDSNEGEETEPKEKELFDVIVMDTFDPQENVEYTTKLYEDDAFIRNLYDSLSTDGVLIMQIGSSPEHIFPYGEMGENNEGSHLIRFIEGSGFKSVHVYDEIRRGSNDPWSFMVACKSHACRYNWYSNQASVDKKIHSMLRQTKSGMPSLTYFDGATMSGYQIPSKKWETLFCRQSPNTKSCKFANGFDKKIKNTPITEFEVKISSVGKNSGRGVYAKNGIPKGSFISLETAVKKLHFDHEVTDTIETYADAIDTKPNLDRVTNYMYGYGFQADYKVSHEYFVDGNIMTFVNHGCNSTENIDAIVGEFMNDRKVFDPSRDRHLPHMGYVFTESEHSIEAGQEILSDYFKYSTDEEEKDTEFRQIDAMCKGQILSGSITQIELSKGHKHST